MGGIEGELCLFRLEFKFFNGYKRKEGVFNWGYRVFVFIFYVSFVLVEIYFKVVFYFI